MAVLKAVVMLSSDLAGLGVNGPKANFISFDTNSSVEEIVSLACVCEGWEIDEEEHRMYSLIFEDTKKYLTEGIHNNIEALQMLRELRWQILQHPNKYII